MAFLIEQPVAAPPARTWEVVTDVVAFGRTLPLTVVEHDPGPPRVGWTFVGVTGIGPLRFADPMTLERFEPAPAGLGGRFDVRKHGRWLAGWAQVEVTPAAPDRADPVGAQHSIIRWMEEIIVRPRAIGGPALPVVDAAMRVLFTRAVREMGRRAEGGHG